MSAAPPSFGTGTHSVRSACSCVRICTSGTAFAIRSAAAAPTFTSTAPSSVSVGAVVVSEVSGAPRCRRCCRGSAGSAVPRVTPSAGTDPAGVRAPLRAPGRKNASHRFSPWVAPSPGSTGTARATSQRPRARSVNDTHPGCPGSNAPRSHPPSGPQNSIGQVNGT